MTSQNNSPSNQQASLTTNLSEREQVLRTWYTYGVVSNQFTPCEWPDFKLSGNYYHAPEDWMDPFDENKHSHWIPEW